MVTGSLQADETTTVTSEVVGRVIELAADFGQTVKKGQVVARLDPVELALQLERSRASLAQALARVGMDANQETAPDSTPMSRQAKAQMEDARTKYENAEKTGEDRRCQHRTLRRTGEILSRPAGGLRGHGGRPCVRSWPPSGSCGPM